MQTIITDLELLIAASILDSSLGLAAHEDYKLCAVASFWTQSLV